VAANRKHQLMNEVMRHSRAAGVE